MQPLTAADPESHSPDLIAQNVAQLKRLFPEAFTEGRIDFDVLRQLLGDSVEETEEKYGLNWHGKRAARRLALTPSTGTLRPCPEESVDWDTTQNLMIEGDNLEVLKLLQRSYTGKVKLIYIDPPYNTGNDFVYPDDYRDSIRNYHELTGQAEEGQKITSNSESSGRYHTDWLNMIYPRLKLASMLLKRDGILCVSIDDSETANLRKACDEVFGEENFLQLLVWQRHAGGGNDSRYFAIDHEYILVYAKNKAAIPRLRVPLTEEERAEYKLIDRHFATLGPHKLKSFRRMRPDDPRPGLTYDIILPDRTVVRDTWKWEEPRFLQAVKDDKVQFRQQKNGAWTVEYKIYLKSDDSEDESEERMQVPRSLLLDFERNSDGKRQVRETLGEDNVFSNPKPIGLLSHLISFSTGSEDIVLDFFAGSGTTGHSVMLRNLHDGGCRRFILVQLPELLDPSQVGETVAAAYCDQLGKPRNIAEITKERLRRAGKKVQAENPMFAGDLGFRVFKLDSSNIHAWDPHPDDLAATLEQYAEHLKADRTEQDILYEVLLKLGFDLCAPIAQQEIAGKMVYSVGAGRLIVCLPVQIGPEDVEPLGQGLVEWWRGQGAPAETRLILRDSAFADDVVKTNLTAILAQGGLTNVRSL